MTKQIGLDMYLYRNAGTFESPSWQLIENVRDLSGPDSFVEADVSTRGSGLKQTEPTLQDLSFDWEMVHDPDDTDFTALQTAYRAKTKVELAFADGPIATSGTKYMRVETKIVKWERGEPLEGSATRNVTAKPCYGARSSYVTVGA
jgi:hypothetical protein